MKTRLNMDQTTAWLLAVLGAGVVFGGLYMFTKSQAKKYEQRIEAFDHSQAAESKHAGHGHEAPAASPAHKDSHGHEAPAASPSHKDSHGHEAPAASPSHEGSHGHPAEEGSHGRHEKEEDSSHGEHHESRSSPQGSGQRPQAEWSYEGRTGPEFWGDLSPSYADCQVGRKQSPIDIKDSARRHELRPLKFYYRNGPMSLHNDGHTILGPYSPGSYLLVDGQRFNLVQMQFHLPSEHTVNGIPYDMELQLMHQNDEDHLAVIAVLMEEGGQNNKGLEKIWEGLPKKKGEKSGQVTFNAEELLPKQQNYYAYEGSVTTPPCQEGVKWFVFADPIKISANQIDRFISIYRSNARPTQALNQRQISLSSRT